MSMLENYWNQFQDLLPKSPVTVGTVVSSTGDQFVLTLLDGSVVRATSATAYADGAKVFVKDGFITGEAPVLTPVDIEV